jgi:hypothetical protein
VVLVLVLVQLVLVLASSTTSTSTSPSASAALLRRRYKEAQRRVNPWVAAAAVRGDVFFCALLL